jgi:hypothetical protein
MATFDQNRRDALKLFGVGGIVFASGLAGCAHRASANAGAGAGHRQRDFYFLQLSDTHWGYSGAANPDAAQTLRQTVEQINRSGARPDFIIFTGDLTHTTDDAAVRRQRLGQFKDIVAGLDVKQLRFIPGEHDASLDQGAAFRDLIGPLSYSFDWKGIHFVALDNVSTPNATLGQEQLAWLSRDLSTTDASLPVVVFAHRPLFDLYPQWDWTTADGAQAIQILQTRKQVTVFYGHIHQEHHHLTGSIAHHAARSLIFPLPAPGSLPKKAPIPWNPSSPDHGLGFRQVGPFMDLGATVREVPFATGLADSKVRTVKIVAGMFDFRPSRIELELGAPAILELTSADRHHGFNAPDFNLRADIAPGVTTRLHLQPTKAGIFPFHCDAFCGEGHDMMSGEIVVASRI